MSVLLFSGQSLHCLMSVQARCQLMLRARSIKQQSMPASHCWRSHIARHCGTVATASHYTALSLCYLIVADVSHHCVDISAELLCWHQFRTLYATFSSDKFNSNLYKLSVCLVFTDAQLVRLFQHLICAHACAWQYLTEQLIPVM